MDRNLLFFVFLPIYFAFSTHQIPQEAVECIEGATATCWPQTGSIVFENVAMRYREGLPLVLHGISLTIRAREKVGVVGRTGAGKSSLALALFRLVELTSGRISIDGIDIASVGLNDLRERLSIIPQDAVLFSGTLRSNLDPFAVCTDTEVWHALDRVCLKNTVASLSEGLAAPVIENGENYSVGQRSQICLARALLRRSRVIVLDEPTASIDMETDNVIQKTIKEDFGDCTIVTIAHRLNTIIDYDRVLVLDHGRIKEFDTPAQLLRDHQGTFSAMVRETGASNAAVLQALANAAEEARGRQG
jgi:ATP-binding cassette subfamily C (CFTR/MRP) protein 1